MKSLILMLFLSLSLTFTSIYPVIAQGIPPDQTEQENLTQNQPEKQGFFTRLVGKVKDGAYGLGIAFIFGIFAKHGWTLTIKKFAKAGKYITKEVGEAFLESSNFLEVLDNAIRDDGKLKENSARELIDAGKRVVAEGKDVVVIIKKKP